MKIIYKIIPFSLAFSTASAQVNQNGNCNQSNSGGHSTLNCYNYYLPQEPVQSKYPPQTDQNHARLMDVTKHDLKQNTQIFVVTDGVGGDRLRVANALRTELKHRHFPLAASENEAALVVDISSASISLAAPKDANDRLEDDPQQAASYASTKLKLRATWVDGILFLNQDINSGSVRGKYVDVQEKSLEKAAVDASRFFVVVP